MTHILNRVGSVVSHTVQMTKLSRSPIIIATRTALQYRLIILSVAGFVFQSRNGVTSWMQSYVTPHLEHFFVRLLWIHRMRQDMCAILKCLSKQWHGSISLDEPVRQVPDSLQKRQNSTSLKSGRFPFSGPSSSLEFSVVISSLSWPCFCRKFFINSIVPLK